MSSYAQRLYEQVYDAVETEATTGNDARRLAEMTALLAAIEPIAKQPTRDPKENLPNNLRLIGVIDGVPVFEMSPSGINTLTGLRDWAARLRQGGSCVNGVVLLPREYANLCVSTGRLLEKGD